MPTGLYNTYSKLSKQKLFQVLLHPEDYTADAIQTAKKVIEEKGWQTEIDALLSAKERELEEKRLADEDEIIEKASYYKALQNAKEKQNSFQVRISDMPKFEGILEAEGIEFFREDKNIGAQLDVYPTQTYYFNDEDSERVDQIVKELQLITSPYMDYKPFIKMELLVVAAVVIIILVAIVFLT